MCPLSPNDNHLSLALSHTRTHTCTHSHKGNWEREHKMHTLLMVRHCDIFISFSKASLQISSSQISSKETLPEILQVKCYNI